MIRGKRNSKLPCLVACVLAGKILTPRFTCLCRKRSFHLVGMGSNKAYSPARYQHTDQVLPQNAQHLIDERYRSGLRSKHPAQKASACDLQKLPYGHIHIFCVATANRLPARVSNSGFRRQEPFNYSQQKKGSNNQDRNKGFHCVLFYKSALSITLQVT
jgi:hypothetical protein